MNSDVCIFTEGGQKSGYGHITRCISLYDEIEKNGLKPIFIINGDDKVSDVLKNREYIIDNWYDNASKYLISRPYSIIDSYLSSAGTYECIYKNSRKCLYIDDNNRMNYPQGIIVNPSIYGYKLDYSMSDSQEYLLGSQYIILRKPFQQKTDRQIKNEVKNILIVIGGSDIRNLTPEILSILCTKEFENIGKHVVVGSGLSNANEMAKIKKLGNVYIHYNLDALEMHDLMLLCDIAITAAGQTVYELISTQLPFVCIKIIDNQTNNINGLLEQDIIKDYINWEDINFRSLCHEKVLGLLLCETRKVIANKMKDVINGYGVTNIIIRLTE